MKKQILKQKLLIKKIPSNLIIDEWIYHYIIGEDGETKREKALIFVNRLYSYKGSILMLEDSPFDNKIKLLTKNTDVRIREISKMLFIGILLDSKKTVRVSEKELKPLSKRLLKIIPDDDQYLIRLFLYKKNSCIITSDTRLVGRLRNEKYIKIMLHDDFVNQYMPVNH